VDYIPVNLEALNQFDDGARVDETAPCAALAWPTDALLASKFSDR